MHFVASKSIIIFCTSLQVNVSENYLSSVTRYFYFVTDSVAHGSADSVKNTLHHTR